jgi:predicted exporter
VIIVAKLRPADWAPPLSAADRVVAPADAKRETAAWRRNSRLLLVTSAALAVTSTEGRMTSRADGSKADEVSDWDRAEPLS